MTIYILESKMKYDPRSGYPNQEYPPAALHLGVLLAYVTSQEEVLKEYDRLRLTGSIPAHLNEMRLFPHSFALYGPLNLTNNSNYIFKTANLINEELIDNLVNEFIY